MVNKISFDILKKDVAKLQSVNAPDEDIDQHIKESGWTPDDFIKQAKSIKPTGNKMEQIPEGSDEEKNAKNIVNKSNAFGLSGPTTLSPEHPLIMRLAKQVQRKAEIFAKPAVENVTMGLGNNLVKKLPEPQKSLEGGAATPDQIMEAGLHGAGTLAGNLAGGEIIGGVGKIVGKIAEPVIKPAIMALKNVIEPAEIASKFRSAIWKPMVEKSKVFGGALENLMAKNPEKIIPIESEIKSLQNIIKSEKAYGPSVTEQSIKDIGGSLEKFVNGDFPAKDLTLKESQNLLNEMNGALNKGVKTGAGRSPEDIPKLNIINRIKLAMSDAFPEMEKIRSQYKQTIDDFNTLKSFLNPKRTLPSLKSGVAMGVGKTPNSEIQDIITRNMSPADIREFGGYQKLYKTLSHAFKVPLTDIKLSPIDLIEKNKINPSIANKITQGMMKGMMNGGNLSVKGVVNPNNVIYANILRNAIQRTESGQ